MKALEVGEMGAAGRRAAVKDEVSSWLGDTPEADECQSSVAARGIGWRRTGPSVDRGVGRTELEPVALCLEAPESGMVSETVEEAQPCGFNSCAQIHVRKR
jgi:hypothetical protein